LLKLKDRGIDQFGLDHCKAISQERPRVLTASSKSEIAQGRALLKAERCGWAHKEKRLSTWLARLWE